MQPLLCLVLVLGLVLVLALLLSRCCFQLPNFFVCFQLEGDYSKIECGKRQPVRLPDPGFPSVWDTLLHQYAFNIL